jgi:hypothetical protein
MKESEFVAAIRLAVEKPAAQNCLENYQDPPGRNPDAELVQLSQWYTALSEEDQSMVARAMKDAVRASVFGFFCVLDGVRPIEDGSDKGSLELWHVKNELRTRINDPTRNLLHDEYKAE